MVWPSGFWLWNNSSVAFSSNIDTNPFIGNKTGHCKGL
ncbi:hypothetical protein PLUTE_a2032 [Pseudoalteromonas luteoviolacea DSM 6061]|nr:hypothetical protein [Pseudoalteromonas luteoviolacea DSM 6061]